jgi:hypothetical protein
MKLLKINHKMNSKYFIPTIFLSLGLSFFGYLTFFQSPNLSKREYAFTLILWFVLTPLVYLILSRILQPNLNVYSPRIRYKWIVLSIGVGILFTIGSRPPQIILLQPVHTLQITVPAGNQERIVTLKYAKSSLRDIGFGEFKQEGNWQRTEEGLIYKGSEPASLTWSGRAGESVTLIFHNTPFLERVQTGWDGELALVVPSESEFIEVIAPAPLYTGWVSPALSRLVIGFIAGFIFLVLTLYLTKVEIKSTPVTKRKKGYWLLYTLPMIVVWGLFLLVFYPGLLTQDTTLQWEQSFTGNYSDVHPIFYALLINGLSRIDNSPAVVVWAQILMLSLSLGWGLGELERMGCSRKALWALSVLFAILPVNILGAIVLRKDIPFSAAILVLSVIFFKVALSRGDWLKGKWQWLGLGLTLGVITLSRINGLTVSVGSLLVFLLFYRRVWRRLFAAAGVFALMLVLMYGPVYSALKVKHVSEYGPVLFLHHIAAHLEAGTFLDNDQVSYLSSLAPLDGWNYDCCTVSSTMEKIFPGAALQDYSLPILKQDPGEPMRTSLALFIKNPSVDLRHMLCAGQIVWNLQSSCPDRIVVRMQPLELFKDPEDSFRILPNRMGFTTDSRLPGLIAYANPYLQVYSEGFYHWLNFTPAIFLYLAIYSTGVLAYRLREWKVALYLIPALLQSITLFLVTISQAYRYQYGVVLVGLISLGFLFVPKPGEGTRVVPAREEDKE